MGLFTIQLQATVLTWFFKYSLLQCIKIPIFSSFTCLAHIDQRSFFTLVDLPLDGPRPPCMQSPNPIGPALRFPSNLSLAVHVSCIHHMAADPVLVSQTGSSVMRCMCPSNRNCFCCRMFSSLVIPFFIALLNSFVTLSVQLIPNSFVSHLWWNGFGHSTTSLWRFAGYMWVSFIRSHVIPLPKLPWELQA